jgi:hypothetical protein
MSDQIDSKFSEIGVLLEELRKKMERAEALEKEIERIVSKADLLQFDSVQSFLGEVMLGVPELDEDAIHRRFSFYRLFREKKFIHSAVALLRALAKRGEELGKMYELARRLKVPEAPYKFSKPLDMEAELLEGAALVKVRIKEVGLTFDNRPIIHVKLERGGTTEWRDVERAPLLLVSLHQEVRELIGEAIGRFEQYCQELEGLRTRIVTEHPREILMGDL